MKDIQIVIRKATFEDAPAIVSALRAIAATPGFFSSLPSEISVENIMSTLSSVNDGSGICLVAEAHGTMVGHAFLVFHRKQALRHVANLDALAVHLGWQGQGIGSRLLERVIDWAKQSQTIRKIELHVRASNSYALSLYKKVGFQEEGRLRKRVKINDTFVDDIVMGLDLTESQPTHPHQINHITLICKDIEKTGLFLKKILGAVEYYSTTVTTYSLSKEKFFKVGDIWIVTMEGESVLKTYNHIAFQADAREFPKLRQELEKLGLEILPGRSRRPEEGESIYFYDYDNHLFEFHSGNLEERLEHYKALDEEKVRFCSRRN